MDTIDLDTGQALNIVRIVNHASSVVAEYMLAKPERRLEILKEVQAGAAALSKKYPELQAMLQENQRDLSKDFKLLGESTGNYSNEGEAVGAAAGAAIGGALGGLAGAALGAALGGSTGRAIGERIKWKPR